MPLIGHILEKGHMPVFAGNRAQQSIVSEAYGKDVPLLPLQGYDITYSPLNRVAQAGLLLQIPRVLRTIRQEHQWLQEVVRDHKIGGIIADNRYGLYHATVPAVIMTHQLHVLSGMGSVADGLVQRMHYRYLQRFGDVWVADTAGGHSLAGMLAQPEVLPKNTKYIGLLSRFANGNNVPTDTSTADTLLVLLSGPEPQRSMLSQVLWRQAAGYEGRVIFAEGSDKAARPADIPPHITWHARLAGSVLEEAMRAARLVVCRSGYSTLMDLAAIGKRAILIPTPGQTEQEYLGRRMHEQGIHHTMPQNGFDLGMAVKAAGHLHGYNAIPATAFAAYRHVLDEWLATL
ncbi:glycosyltransferase [Nemorincola caseinilytica]|uniref:Glycosyltransferase n=1 Tax=Nemorincola caseinilytica TaxID=2054315 RepID=A0ABP8NAY7_9BACT